ncbi:hypothetical protein QZM97_13505 [Burkholderia orbicola]|uniref:hypothetical protein n=1 Tax=Burkholderia cepacia complex TaxID=87882 RepID=UPI00098FC3F8|nr:MULTISPECIES: hypothetical protein [Burkholderia cepacia complex]BEV51223.1 hypothetical protein BconGalA64_37220 [Burkholderia contaminans]AQT51821.1 hypothetical protein BHQ31_16990 [Burkholderia cenocepacia]MDN7534817.1 hypothetical protein [Burkholderia orbicola]MDN7991099.1 hypothetical protein [Burkholderia orbicola]UJH76023.1 hypothetical protein L0U95_29430 [Burkholderia cenocepacia]
MSKLGIAEGIKLRGNVNRITEIMKQGTLEDAVACFALGGMTLQANGGDVPLLRNLSELTRTALPKRVVKDYFGASNGVVMSLA